MTRLAKINIFSASLLAVAMFNVNLLGRAQIYADVNPSVIPANAGIQTILAAALDIGVSFEPLPFDEAVKYFRNKLNMSPEQFRALSLAAQHKAFAIADGANGQVRDSIKQMLDDALSNGMTFKDFQSSAANVLESAGIAPREPWYWRTVYDSNLGQAYQAGRWQQITDPDVTDEFPYLRYVSALLPTSRPSHTEKHGLIYPIGDPFWDIWYPKNGFNCYCTTMSVSESLLKRRGWTVSTGMSFRYPDPDPGWGGNAGKAGAI